MGFDHEQIKTKQNSKKQKRNELSYSVGRMYKKAFN